MLSSCCCQKLDSSVSSSKWGKTEPKAGLESEKLISLPVAHLRTRWMVDPTMAMVETTASWWKESLFPFPVSHIVLQCHWTLNSLFLLHKELFWRKQNRSPAVLVHYWISHFLTGWCLSIAFYSLFKKKIEKGTVVLSGIQMYSLIIVNFLMGKKAIFW